MASKTSLLPSPLAAHRRRKPVEVTGLLAQRSLSVGEIERVSRVLAAEGFADLLPTRITIDPVGTDKTAPVSATIMPDDRHRPMPGAEASLSDALAAARTRGAALQEELLAGPDMLSTAEMADRLGMSEEGIRQKRKRHEVLGLQFARRGLRYPAWQILPDRQLLPALPRLFAVLGDDPWRLFRFLLQHHGELAGKRALDALSQGRLDAVLDAAENAARGAFA
jgi:hypothetical protein